jgi:hypothetical protein
MSNRVAKESEETCLTTLDRNVHVVLDASQNDETPSRADGISASLERLHTLHGTCLILESSHELELGPSCFATACTIFHRFYKQVSLKQHDVWSVAMACTLLATKLEEEPKTIQQIIEEYASIYTKRLIFAGLDEDTADKILETTTSGIPNTLATVLFRGKEEGRWKTSGEKIQFCNTHMPQKLNKMGPVYQEWHKALSRMEALVLRQLGFVFYWIPDAHPHKFILYFCQVLELKGDTNFVQSAWNYCNDALRIDLCTRYKAEVIAAAAILLAAKDRMVRLPTQPRLWWQVFLGIDAQQGQDMVDAANIMAGLVQMQRSAVTRPSNSSEEKVAATHDWLLASHGVVQSLMKRTEDHETSFNDANSFLWEYQKELFEKEIGKGGQ